MPLLPQDSHPSCVLECERIWKYLFPVLSLGFPCGQHVKDQSQQTSQQSLPQQSSTRSLFLLCRRRLATLMLGSKYSSVVCHADALLLKCLMSLGASHRRSTRNFTSSIHKPYLQDLTPTRKILYLSKRWPVTHHRFLWLSLKQK
jgi:hypothetical protein